VQFRFLSSCGIDYSTCPKMRRENERRGEGSATSLPLLVIRHQSFRNFCGSLAKGFCEGDYRYRRNFRVRSTNKSSYSPLSLALFFSLSLGIEHDVTVRCQRETMQSRVVIEVMESSLQTAFSFPPTPARDCCKNVTFCALTRCSSANRSASHDSFYRHEGRGLIRLC